MLFIRTIFYLVPRLGCQCYGNATVLPIGNGFMGSAIMAIAVNPCATTGYNGLLPAAFGMARATSRVPQGVPAVFSEPCGFAK